MQKKGARTIPSSILKHEVPEFSKKLTALDTQEDELGSASPELAVGPQDILDRFTGMDRHVKTNDKRGLPLDALYSHCLSQYRTTLGQTRQPNTQRASRRQLHAVGTKSTREEAIMGGQSHG